MHNPYNDLPALVEKYCKPTRDKKLQIHFRTNLYTHLIDLNQYLIVYSVVNLSSKGKVTRLVLMEADRAPFSPPASFSAALYEYLKGLCQLGGMRNRVQLRLICI